MGKKILIVDDDRTVCSSLSLLLKKKGFLPMSVNHPAVVLEVMEEFSPDLILLDLNFTIDTSGRQGKAILKKIVHINSDMPVILMTGWATVQLAVEGMKIGAKDFIAKPWDNKQLIQSIEDILALSTYKSNEKVDASLLDSNDDPMSKVIGNHPAFVEILDIAKRVAKTDASVLITGESGTGKEVISEAIHELSLRKDNAFIKVNLGGLSTNLFESEMFGHKRGSFTGAVADRQGRFEAANNGTIFLDEIGELPIENQVKLLRVLQEKTFEPVGSNKTIKSNVRVLSATNKDLSSMSSNGSFREDLYYRINLITIHIPPLRERKTDIPLLVKHFVKVTCNAYQLDAPYIDEETMKWLTNQEYAGNIRELKNLVQRALLLNMNKKDLTIKDFIKDKSTTSASKVNLPEVGQVSLQDMEIRMITKALAYHNYSISRTAASLGITRSSLYRRLEKYNIAHES